MRNKWIIATAGTLVHLLLGTVYAWSYFQAPITEHTGWSNSQAAWTFSLSIFMLGVTAAWAGSKMPKFGPCKLAMLGGVLYGVGFIAAGYALKNQSLALLYLGFGFLGGIGLGMAYVTPVATVSAWFTYRQGLATGMVVMGFGLGALLMSKLLAPLFLKLSNGNLSTSFYYIGLVMLVLIPLLATFLTTPSASGNEQMNSPNTHLEIRKHLATKPFIALWLLFMVNIVAGMIFISFQSPLLQDLLKLHMPPGTNFQQPEVRASLATAGATLIAISSLFNGIGRFVWASLSDKIGRIRTFRILLALQAAIFTLLIFLKHPIAFSILVCIVLLCYGGGFGVLPSLIRDMYGSKLMAALYGIMLTAWGAGGIIGPQIVAYMKDSFAHSAAPYSFAIGAALLLIGLALAYTLTPQKNTRKRTHS